VGKVSQDEELAGRFSASSSMSFFSRPTKVELSIDCSSPYMFLTNAAFSFDFAFSQMRLILNVLFFSFSHPFSLIAFSYYAQFPDAFRPDSSQTSARDTLVIAHAPVVKMLSCCSTS
jgi:hypothetical protein